MLWSWLTTVDHKRIGVLYGVTAFLFFLMGGVEALLIRAQLAVPNGGVVDPDLYNQLFTMHALTMIFLAVMPLGAAFFNFLIPLMIGARDVAFPRLNALSYWIFLSGGLLLTSSFFLGGAPDTGWFAYAPLNESLYSGSGMNYYVIGLLILGLSSLAAALNFAVTIINMRVPGMTMMRLPVFAWMTLVVAFLLILALPVLTVALIQLLFDRNYDTSFFLPGGGGDPILWQHLFWVFGHPEVYILILPAMGIVSEILPTFSRKPLFGFPAMSSSPASPSRSSAGPFGAHHMFASGTRPRPATPFLRRATMAIAIPTGVKSVQLAWDNMGREYTASRRPCTLPSGIHRALFTIGGNLRAACTHAIAPSDLSSSTDTYYIVAHIHYVLFGGAIMGTDGAASIYWWPKDDRAHVRMTGHGARLTFWLDLPWS